MTNWTLQVVKVNFGKEEFKICFHCNCFFLFLSLIMELFMLIMLLHFKIIHSLFLILREVVNGSVSEVVQGVKIGVSWGGGVERC